MKQFILRQERIRAHQNIPIKKRKKEHTKKNNSVDVRVYQLPTPHFHIIGIYLNDVTLCTKWNRKMKQHHTDLGNIIPNYEHGEQKKNDINIIITIMGKNIKFQFTLPYKCCFYVNYLRRLIQLIYETRHPHVRRLWFCRYEIVDSTYYTRTFYKGYTCKTFLNRTSFQFCKRFAYTHDTITSHLKC